MESSVVWGEFLQADMAQYGLAAAVVVFSKLLGAPIVLSLVLAGVGLVLGAVPLPGAGAAFQSYLSGWSLIGILAVVFGMAIVRVLSGRGRGVFLPLFLILGAMSVLNFFEPQALPHLMGDRVAELSVVVFACLALCGAVIMTLRSATSAVCAVLWVCVAIGFNGEGILRALPGDWFNGQLRSLVLAESGAGDELPRFALRVVSNNVHEKLVAVVSRDPAAFKAIRSQIALQGTYQVFAALDMTQVPASVTSVLVDLDSIVAYPLASCQPSAVAALLGVTPICREELRGPGVVCVSSQFSAEVLKKVAPGVACDKIVPSVAALSLS